MSSKGLSIEELKKKIDNLTRKSHQNLDDFQSDESLHVPNTIEDFRKIQTLESNLCSSFDEIMTQNSDLFKNHKCTKLRESYERILRITYLQLDILLLVKTAKTFGLQKLFLESGYDKLEHLKKNIIENL